ncbi:assimilatory sulfite reductase (NADPH) flavoprotein subunit [Dyella tabacisoli]|uniref:Sulfite reductase [NADPH] flavoprotein alpha-component n=1 Tax=Dyella tabacisoli TaxID=2282381 RepID=A0A369UN98_9GAMM|nr:assimilatory sulfite reductase (NADPH) flavoprotein subunit [Dyella tabacisoli]RDD81198.1 assimilatory sulfite reductase (NADPH) flavoprotein subunit [Dyella tabacisoli]
MSAVIATGIQAPALNADKAALLARLADGLGPVELYWAAAWLASQASGAGVTPAQAPAKAATERLTIVYGSQTGNAKRIAERLAERSEAAGLPVRLLRADAYPQRELAQERQLIVVISTQGDGDPPDDALGLFEFIVGKRAPKLPALRFAVLGLGDSSYPQFCTIGQQLDARLTELGGARFLPLGIADVDHEVVANPWLEQALEAARDLLKDIVSATRVTPLYAVPNRALYNREQPFAASVLANQRIVSRDSDRDIRHVELSLAGSGLTYEPGDAFGVWPQNPPALVAQWLDALRLEGSVEVAHDGRSLPLSQWLARERELTRLNQSFLSAHAALSGHADLARVLQPEHADEKAALFDSFQPIDLLRLYPAAWSAEALVSALRPMTPRLYSIASSSKAVGDEVHLTVTVVDYQAHGTQHWGAASSFLAATDEDGTVPVFIESNERFRLPADPTRDIIMIGPGTGVAPFRAFVQERQEIGASGRNWLFFGNRHFGEDFLYQVEWQEALKKGSLHRLDLAFSRDGENKVYVQQRLLEQGQELYAWLKSGAYLYVCGDSTHMAKDVHNTLIEIIVTHGRQPLDDAKAWLADLMQQGRYARDVY